MADLERRRGYVPNHGPQGLGGFMMDPRKTGKIALQAATTVAGRAKRLVQQDTGASGPRRDKSGRFTANRGLANSFEVEQTVVVLNENPPNPRLSAIVINRARHAARWEFGSAPGHRNAHRSLRRAGASVGELRGGVG